MHRTPQDLKYRGTKPKHHSRHGRGYFYRHASFWTQGDYFRFYKEHLRRLERRTARQALANGEEPEPYRFRRKEALYQVW